jgi:hypothetical protein
MMAKRLIARQVFDHISPRKLRPYDNPLRLCNSSVRKARASGGKHRKTAFEGAAASTTPSPDSQRGS